MPLYPYHCTKCGYRFEKIQKFDDERLTECPKCQGALERLLTAPRFHFVGAGWYVNDYSGKSSEPAQSTSAESKPVETKREAPAASKPAAAPTAPAAAPPAASAS